MALAEAGILRDLIAATAVTANESNEIESGSKYNVANQVQGGLAGEVAWMADE